MPDGDRVLTEAVWAVFRTGLDLLRDFVENDIAAETDDVTTGVQAFDALTAEQKLALLAEVALALRDPKVPTPIHTAANEGAIKAVLLTFRDMLVFELEDARTPTGGTRTNLRQLLLAAGKEIADPEEPEDDVEPLPDVATTGTEPWDGVLDLLDCTIFWDMDYALGDEFLDLPPAEGRRLLDHMGIDQDYFLAVPAEPGEAALIAARQTLARLIGLPVPDDDGLYPALEDQFHDLVVGPCSPDEIAAWEGYPWIDVIRMTEPGWDCDYATWAAGFSQALPPTPFQWAPATAESDQVLPNRLKVERRGDTWVVRDEKGWYWCGLVDNGWTDAPDDEGLPALSFPTEREAKAVFAQANRMYEERKRRHQEALAQLGLEEGE
jgi:hypothetical protein